MKEYTLLPLPKRPAVTEKALTPMVLVIEGANLKAGRAMEDMRMPATSRAGPARVTLRRAAIADILDCQGRWKRRGKNEEVGNIFFWERYAYLVPCFRPNIHFWKCP